MFAILLELGTFPLHFNIVLEIMQHVNRLEKSGISPPYCKRKPISAGMFACKTQAWYNI